ncbi:MAG: hypothetical protein EOO20_14870 [Chryseobacterium sp.]|nr:MAG: hypothetical protein EOO20_14870 [Chryseobacterium sp.]
MQLAYIWVSDFRNIENQGYNFSSKEIIHYDHLRNSLTIETNPNYIQQFFASRIYNITGIVGQNASGKTNLLELINYVMDGGNTKIVKPFFVLFEDHGRYELYKHKISAEIEVLPEKDVAVFEYSNAPLPMNAVYFSNTFDSRRHNFGKRIFDISTNKLFQLHTENMEQNIKLDVVSQLNFLGNNDMRHVSRSFRDEHAGSNLIIRPTHIQLITPTWTSIVYRAKQFDQKYPEHKRNGSGIMQQFCSSFRKRITDNESSNSFMYFFAFMLFIDILSTRERDEPQILDAQQSLDSSRSSIDKLNSDGDKFLERLGLIDLVDQRINEVFSMLTGSIAEFLRSQFPERKKRIELLSSLPSYQFSEITKFNEGVYSSRRIHFETPFNEQAQNFLSKYLKATESSALNLTIDWGGISAGQKAFLILFSRLYAIRTKAGNDDVILTLDEGDLYFHPKWQTEFLSRLIEFLPAMFGSGIQLVLTTHSPFLVSDLTKNHLIFLRQKDGRSVAIPGRKMLKETFGGNIGELYLNAFFLNGSLISQFAADRIDNLAKKIKEQPQYLNQDDLRLIEQVGDDMIKNQLEYLRDDKNR